MQQHKILITALFISLSILFCPGFAGAQDTVEEVMDSLLTRLYENLSLDELYVLNDEQVQERLLPNEHRILATKHWCFTVNVPVIVSVLRQVDQKVIPFWLEESGFLKTDLLVKNMENWTYEVWQKKFPAGRVELGINGFDNFRPHYLVCVGAQEPNAELRLTDFHPKNQTVVTMEKGALTYHDWTELVLTEVPEELQGQKLLPTIRGRAREACLVGSFRKTQFPSSDAPDPVFLTWSGNPQTTQNIQWRTSLNVDEGAVRYRAQGSNAEYKIVQASRLKMEDRMLANDRYCHWFTAVLKDLKAGTVYEYAAGSPSRDNWSETAEFKTAPATPEAFTFFYCSDTHNRKEWGNLLQTAFKRNPEAAFCVISGDLVGTGLHRDDWDAFLNYGEAMFRTRPVMPAIGNHDAQLGLGAGMYLDIFGLPENGPAEIPTESAYTIRYGNAEFFVLDVMSETEPQGVWLGEQLARSNAAWKIAVLHFPFYTNEEAYPDLIEAWGSQFDTYHVDLVFTGHIHTYLRTYPMKAEKRAASGEEGTIYITSVSIPSRARGNRNKPDFVEVWAGGGSFCNVININGDQLNFKAVTMDGSVKDEFTLEK